MVQPTEIIQIPPIFHVLLCVCVYVCICMCVVLCDFITCIDLHDHHLSQDAELFPELHHGTPL